MPSFEIPDGPTTLALKPEAGLLKGVAVFGVTNKTGEGLTARFSVQIQGDGKPEWYQVQGEPERPVAAGETQTITVVAKIPVTAPPGQHRIKLRAVNVNDTDNDITDSSASVVTIPAPPPPKPKPKPFPWWIVAVIGGVLVVVIGVIIAVVLMTSGPKVPKVIGMDYAAAVAELKKGGYTAAPEIDEPAPGKPLGKVFKQEPEAGKKADPKTVQVKLTVAAPTTVAVPSVTGMDYPAAVAALEKSGFKAAPAINEISPENAMGLVFKQDPAADAQADPKTAEVKLTVAVGETVTVPTVAGKPYVAAQALLEDRGFTVAARVVGQASGQQPDFVLVQNPAAETTAPKGSAVTLTVDPGVVVPNLLNPQVDGITGIKALQAAGADIGTIGSRCGAAIDKIATQSIDPNTKVAKGTKVNITIGSPASNLKGRLVCRAPAYDVVRYANDARSVYVAAPSSAVKAKAFQPN